MSLVVAGLVGGIVYGAIVAMIGSGMTLIYRISGIINFAHGSFLAVAMYLGLSLSHAAGVSTLVMTVVTVPVLSAIGFITYWYGVRRIRGQHHLLAIQLLLGLTFVIEAALLITFGGDIQSAPNVLSNHYVNVLGTGISVLRLTVAALAIVALSALAVTLTRTDWGRRFRAAASDELAGTLCGVDRVRLEAWSWVVGAGSLGLIGPALGAVFPMTPDMGLGFTVLALVVLICGGGSSLLGTVVAGVVVGVAQNFGLLYLPKSYGDLMPYLLLILVLIFWPGGLATVLPSARAKVAR